MNVVIVGCGRAGAELAHQLYCKGHRVSVIDAVARAFNNLPADFRGRTIQGEVLDRGVLKNAGIQEAHGLAAMTNSDSVNAVAAHIARTVYGVPNVVVRNYDPRWHKLYESFGLQTVSSITWSAQRMEEMLCHPDVWAVLTAGNGEVGIYQFRIPAAWAHHSLRQLIPGDCCTPAALTRAGRATLPTWDTELEEGDLLYISATTEGATQLRQRLQEVK